MKPSEQNIHKTKLHTLFTTFFKIGLFSFGGGHAMIPLVQKEVVDKQGWITDKDVLDVVAITEATPGPIATNMATFIGYRTHGKLGAFIATFGVALPSFLIILCLASVIRQFEHIKIIRNAFFGIRAGVLALIIKALYSMYQQCPKGIFSYIVTATVFLAVAFFKVNVLLTIACCAVLGVALSFLRKNKEEILSSPKGSDFPLENKEEILSSPKGSDFPLENKEDV